MWVCFHLHIIGLKFCKIVRPKRGLALFTAYRVIKGVERPKYGDQMQEERFCMKFF